MTFNVTNTTLIGYFSTVATVKYFAPLLPCALILWNINRSVYSQSEYSWHVSTLGDAKSNATQAQIQCMHPCPRGFVGLLPYV